MQFSITDNAAVELSRRFYAMLARGLPVDTALTEARKSLSIAFTNSIEWGTPVLFMRSPDGRLFDPYAPTHPRKKANQKAGKDSGQAQQSSEPVQQEPALSKKPALTLPASKKPPQENSRRRAEDYVSSGMAHYDLKECQQAIQDYDKALEIDPKNAIAYYNRGLNYYCLAQYQRALQDYDKAMEINPKHANGYYGRAITLHNLQEYQRAIQDYDKAMEIDPMYAIAYYGRALAYQHLGEKAKAIDDLIRFLEISHDAEWREKAEQHLKALTQS